jgi:hypothetical protein
MKTHLGEYEFGHGFRRTAQGAAGRRLTVSQILRAAYRKHVRDEHTRLAIKRCLR